MCHMCVLMRVYVHTCVTFVCVCGLCVRACVCNVSIRCVNSVGRVSNCLSDGKKNWMFTCAFVCWDGCVLFVFGVCLACWWVSLLVFDCRCVVLCRANVHVGVVCCVLRMCVCVFKLPLGFSSFKTFGTLHVSNLYV